MIKDFASFAEFQEFFSTEEKCLEYFDSIRFRNGDYCPHCSHKRIMRFSDGKRYRCFSCRKDFTVKTKTIFGESKLPLKTWFTAIYLITTYKKGISSIQLSKFLGVSQKTAWFMNHRLREAMKQKRTKLKGVVEADETYVGGKEKNKHWDKKIKGAQGRSLAGKIPVAGVIERKGQVRAKVLSEVNTTSVENFIASNVDFGSTVYTDDFLGYRNLQKFYTHDSVSHGKKEYGRGIVNSNSIESFWGVFKRGYNGTYHVMSRKHLQRYVDEFVYRFNEKQMKFLPLMHRIAKSDNMPYKVLTS